MFYIGLNGSQFNVQEAQMKRTPLKNRLLPDYTRGEEIANMITHIIGAAVGIAVLVISVIIAARNNNNWAVVGASIYGASMICLYAVSSVYHGLKPCFGKKVMQVIDHCTIYFLIAGTYTPILLSAIRPAHPYICWIVFGTQWTLAAFGAVFTAIDHKKYAKLSMICYIGMGWLIIFALKATIESIGTAGFLYLLGGAVSYTIGAILYGIGKKRKYYHTVFHVFVDIGSILQAMSIIKYVL